MERAAHKIRFAILAAVMLSLMLALPLAWAADPATAPSSVGGPATMAFDPPLGSGKLLLSEDFESTAVGDIPKGFTKTGAVGVVDDVSHSGKKSLRMDAKASGPRRITLKGDILTQLGGTFWGRLYFKVQLPTPSPAGGGNFPVIHSTLVSGTATSPLANDPIEVRVLDTVLGPNGTHQFIYNVQPTRRPEFGKGGAYTHRYTDQWTLAEWYVDYATQTYRLFIDGQEVKDVALHNGAGNFNKTEIPQVFQSLSFGWNNYQQAGTGFVAWIDDIALSKERIGNLGLTSGATTRP
jgi:hypothetical protein